jgi:hypothetical protein
MDNQLGIKLRCGNISYAEIPNNYKRILGVTGTLDSLNEFQSSVIKNF